MNVVKRGRLKEWVPLYGQSDKKDGISRPLHWFLEG